MNQIKFRAYNHKLKELEDVLLICFVNEYVDVLPDRNLEGGSQESWSFKDIVLMQSTGLKDKNGVEIFEGDVIQYDNCSWDGIKTNYFKPKEIVKFKERKYEECYGHGSYGDALFIGFIFDGYWGLPNEGEVIGNIHQHPNLLEQGAENDNS